MTVFWLLLVRAVFCLNAADDRVYPCVEHRLEVLHLKRTLIMFIKTHYIIFMSAKTRIKQGANKKWLKNTPQQFSQ